MEKQQIKPRSAVALWIGAAVAVALMAASVVLTFRNTRQIEDDALVVSHTHEVVERLETVLSVATDAETGQRGYIITGESR